GEEQNPQSVKDRTASLRYWKDKELKLFAVLNIAQEIADKAGQRLVFMHNGQVVLLIVECGDRDDILKQTVILLEENPPEYERYLKFTVTIGIGTVTGEVTNASYSYKDAILALDLIQRKPRIGSTACASKC